MTSRERAAELDAVDELAGLRERFALPADVIYLDGNSLGALPASTPARLARVIEHEWGERLIRSWNEADWFTTPARVAGRLAPLIGADADEVAVADSTSVNLFKLLVAACRLRPGRRTLVLERGSFPTDVYIAGSVAELLGGELRLVDGPDDLPDALDETVAVLSLTHVDFRTGALWPAREVTAQAHRVGALAMWDLCHSAGALDVDLHGWGADLAVGCGYKYLNGGPGAPAFCFVARRHQDGLATPLPGWHGHAEPFAMGLDYAPAPGIGQLAVGTPPMLSLIGLDEALSTMDGVSAKSLRAKGQRLTSLFIELLDQWCPDLVLASPRDPRSRGSQVSYRHADAYPLVQALIERGVIGDFREPDIARFGFAPAYLRFVDVWDAARHVRDALAAGEHRDPRFAARGAVT
ncbi:kynureninase [Solihabitans fulvus]|uniref:Kynureninase n=1 Tax=Solihabitans fulvus TaxID=1892852 RepID=A0A5B2XGI6_9PSEU|nr:kynureninase [Solihabitans fulvus]KAA2262219.1 kynureninase [Solihabitans fulvus]